VEINLEFSTNNISSVEEVNKLAQVCARVCYSKYSFKELLSEEFNPKFVNRLLSSGHHSPFDMIDFGLSLKGIPKFGAMILNNEKVYATNEKSARYKFMDPEPFQKKLYDEWMPVLEETIAKEYPKLSDDKKTKLAQENSRYMTSVFTDTQMIHKVSFRQLNSLMHFFDEYIEAAPCGKFNEKVKDFMTDFNEQLSQFYVKELDPNDKLRALSIFNDKKYRTEYGRTYTTNYDISFAGFAQEHRHRSLNYSMKPILDDSDVSFFIPSIIKKNRELSDKWISDISKVAEYDFPQGMMVNVTESGNIEDFISKAGERLCGHAQLEIMNQTKETLDEYLNATNPNLVVSQLPALQQNKILNFRNPYEQIYESLLPYSKGPKCSFPDAYCSSRCEFTPKYGVERLV